MADQEKGNLKKIFENDIARKIIIITGLIGIALIFISSFFDLSKPEKTSKEECFSVTTYNTEIQTDLQEIISHIDGAGKTEVLLTMENSVEYVYLEDSTTKTKEIQPIIRGVLVVCDGGNDPVVAERITSAVTRALDISATKVCITKLSERG